MRRERERGLDSACERRGSADAGTGHRAAARRLHRVPRPTADAARRRKVTTLERCVRLELCRALRVVPCRAVQCCCSQLAAAHKPVSVCVYLTPFVLSSTDNMLESRRHSHHGLQSRSYPARRHRSLLIHTSLHSLPFQQRFDRRCHCSTRFSRLSQPLRSRWLPPLSLCAAPLRSPPRTTRAPTCSRPCRGPAPTRTATRPRLRRPLPAPPPLPR